MKAVILHYHFFKNAGTSVDEILQQNFPGQWINAEFDGMDNRDAVGQWIGAHPEAVAFSSHTAQFPLPARADIRIFPILFLRDPLDRIRSAYDFEKTQISDSLGARLARQTDLAGYIRNRLDISNDYQCRNFQTFRLARLVPGPRIAELDRAVSALRQLPFVGVVERFDLSMKRLELLLRPLFPGFTAFTARRNVKAEGGSSLEERREALRKTIGGALFDELLEANMKDICLHQAAATVLSLSAVPETGQTVHGAV
jgi:hypothetical protein